MPVPRATEAAIRRAISVWTKAGLAVGKLEVTAEGTIRISAPEMPNDKPTVKTNGPKQWGKGT